jgi:hypothetical protein
MAYKYAVDTDKGTFEVALDQEVPDTEAGRVLLQRLVAQQLRYQEAERQRPQNRVLQAVLDAPAALANTMTEFISPDPPGPGRRRVVPEVKPDAVSVGGAVEKTIEKMVYPTLHTYEVEMSDGQRVRVNLPFEVPDTERGLHILQRAAQQHLKDQQVPGRLARQALGGARDAAQGAISTPTDILNTVLSYLNPLPPGAQRPPPPYQVLGPMLPDVEPPQGLLEKGVRYGLFRYNGEILGASV